MNDPTKMLEPEFYERLKALAEASDDYLDVMNRRLIFEYRRLGEDGESMRQRQIDLDGVTVAYDGRVVEISQGTAVLYAEADHRGPEYGVDCWVGSKGNITGIVTGIELTGIDDDDG